jgi:hypothetical protein
MIITFHNRKQRGRDRGVSQRERDREEDTERKKQRGREREEETEGKRQRGRYRGERHKKNGTKETEGNCLLPLWRVHEIKRMRLASRTHGLFIT